MTITPQLYDTHTLMGVMREFAPVPNYWLDLCFGSTLNFTDEFIDFEKITENRKLAPLVVPTAQGKPMYSKASKVQRFRPAYVKPKDAVVPSRLIRRLPGELMANMPMDPAQRHQAVVADILRTHREGIERRMEWMAARAIIDGRVTLSDEDYPEQVVDFGRENNHTVTLGVGSRWGDSGVDILGDIMAWRTRVRKARFGGVTNRLTVGADVWEVMRKNADILKQLDTQVRGTNANFISGLREGLEVERVGVLNGSLEVYVYSDYYHNGAGSTVDFMSPKDIVLTGPNVQGVRAFAAILDTDANYQAQSIFSKMWKQEDPSAMFIMSQSAPLMVPVNPNATLKATVLA